MLKQPSLVSVPPKNKFELNRDYELTIDGHLIVVPKGFQYDGASIPSVAWQLTNSPFHPDVMLPSLIHDWLFYNHQTDQETADEIFYKLLRKNGVNYLKSNTMWAAVRTAGQLFWENDDEDLAFLCELYNKVKTRSNFDKYKFPEDVTEKCEC